MSGRIAVVWTYLQRYRRSLALLIYAAIAWAAYATAYVLRFDFAVPPEYAELFRWTVVPLVVIRVVAFRAFRLTRERWRYASTRDVARLVGSCALGSSVFVVFVNVWPVGSVAVPLSVIGMEALLTCVMTAGVWLTYRLVFEHFRQNSSAGSSRRVIIIGAGDAGNQLAREMLRSNTGYAPVAFLDDNPAMWGATLQGIEVAGSPADIESVAARVRADELILAVPSATPQELRRLVDTSDATGLPFKVLPGIADVIAGRVHLGQLREIRIEDLLGRASIQLELPELASDLGGRTVLVTGAAGSIGSELARQVALHEPARLLLLDQSETELFYVELDLRQRFPDLELVPIIADITRPSAVERVFNTYRPDRVFHAAAYKHVPMMEVNPSEAVLNNVIGTWRVADAAGRYAAGKFVLISTDKAVRPSSVMGATKRLAEIALLELQRLHPRTAYSAVRFGNVLGSNGSVLPIFRRQLAAGGPLTVTHPDVTRYFMTIPEAVQLILQAAVAPEVQGRIAMLEMGEPIRIIDLARNLIRLAGESHRVQIVCTGLRPGEKMHEELVAPDEDTVDTHLPKVKVVVTPARGTGRMAELVATWERAISAGDDATVLHGLRSLFPGIAGGEIVDREPPQLNAAVPSSP